METKEASQLLAPYCIWVLAPAVETTDPHLSYYYDFSQSIQEYTAVFNSLQATWKWQPVTIHNFNDIIQSIAQHDNGKIPLILNLCDGDEVNGTPGVSVIHALEKHGLIYTGADAHFYTITTSKIPMKKAFDTAGVTNAAWKVITNNEHSLKGIIDQLGSPLIIKPAVSGGSMGVSIKNVVHTADELTDRVNEIYKGYRGWNLLADGLFVEKFIAGAEYTTFITGSADDVENCRVYEPVKRVFHASLPDTEKFLSFDRLWEIYEEEKPMPKQENFYEYAPAETTLIPALKKLSLEAYAACGGKGYTRIDIRQDALTGNLYLLEANAQCGLSEDENYTSIGAIIKASNVSFNTIIIEILKDALRRSVTTQLR
ncbi:MAG: hypothetical protein RIR12_336 [Bacteroidota bacterium]|jgi:D-alanine-D-alanine ligase